MRKFAGLSAENSKLLTKVMTLGAGTSLPVTLTPEELCRLIGVICSDLEMFAVLGSDFHEIIDYIAPPCESYYDIPEGWFSGKMPLVAGRHVELMLRCIERIPDFSTYIFCLSEIHKRRRKYSRILEAQPLPTMIQISPRALVEFGSIDPQSLASWLTWRKFFYDLDNRAAQETGYLFEPILAAALGGERKSDRDRVVLREKDPTKGRQVDCWKVLPDGTKLAYEFKLRVTIAASGQGRFAEETQFAVDAEMSGARPILVVLDPTANHRLNDLQNAYRRHGGEAYTGEAAWRHLEEEAGRVMSRFIERYVHTPIRSISQFEYLSNGEVRMDLLDLYASNRGSEILFGLGGNERVISRRRDDALAADGDVE